MARRYGESALLTPANLLTMFRLVITPLFIWLMVQRGASYATMILGGAAAASDFFDGVVARRQGTTSSGAFLDPLADKVVVLGSLYTLVFLGAKAHPLLGTQWWLPVVIITLREGWMSWYRSKASRRGLSIPATRLAKYKTMMQDFAIAFCVTPFTWRVHWLAVASIWIAVALTLVTGWQYYRDGQRAAAGSPGAQ
jgi:CDP-diacylglycerol---glycerol-3-phosphate 3-phosphatidyltransferase